MKSFRVLMVSAAAAVLVGGPTLAQGAYSAPPPAPSEAAQYGHHMHAGRAGRLPVELKILWRQEFRTKLKSMPRDQRHAWLREQWTGLSSEQKQTKMAQLQAKWDALPANVRQSLMQRRETRHAAHQARRAEETNSDPGTVAPPH